MKTSNSNWAMGVKIVMPKRKKPVFFQYQNQGRPQPAYLEIDPSKCTSRLICRADYSGEIGNGAPADVWHSRVFRIPISPEVSRRGLKALETDAKFVALVDRLVGGWEDVWNGNHYVGRFDSDAHDSLCWHAWEATMSAWENDQ